MNDAPDSRILVFYETYLVVISTSNILQTLRP